MRLDKETTETFVTWWRDLYPTNPDQERGGQRAIRARLRRCGSVWDIMMEPAFASLVRQFPTAPSPDELPALALTIGVLAHVRTETPTQKAPDGQTAFRNAVAREIGPTDFGGSPNEVATSARFKPNRLEKLLETRDPEECLTAFRRLVRLANAPLNIRDLAQSLLRWPAEDAAADRIRTRWVHDYWGIGNRNPLSALPADAR
ncbi:hypothetical protein Gbfr_005_058 [Gluconobacter frateurii M-2]|nr:hypothetical protein Gbfr_005_058 [Gluconobacter frateurii M-2]